MRIAVVFLLAVFAYSQKWVVINYKNKTVLSEVTKIEETVKRLPVQVVVDEEISDGIKFRTTKRVLRPFYFYNFFYQNRLVYSIKCKNRLDLFREYIFLKNCK